LDIYGEMKEYFDGIHIDDVNGSDGHFAEDFKEFAADASHSND
jgi:hypothetical protein